jgi:hypothetical protein
MTLEKMILKPIQSELHYRGAYRDSAFNLLAPAIPLYRSLVNHLGQFGATLQSLGIESSDLPNAHVSCKLPDLNVVVRVRLDRVEIDFWRAHEISADLTHRIVLATWAAVRGADDSVEIASHFVEIAAIAETKGDHSAALMARYVVAPEALGDVDTGVAFYSRPVPEGQRWLNLILDRVFGQDDRVSVKVTTAFPAAEASLDGLAVYVESLFNAALDNVGLRFETDGQP